MSKIICVIPALNEEKNIADVLKQVVSLVDEVVVVDDGSSDKTAQVAKINGATVLRHIINRGQGASLQTGNEYARINNADIVVHFDADGQFLAKEIKELIAPIINNQAEVVLGSRFLDRKSNMPKFKEIIIMPIARFVNRFVLGSKIKLTDPQCGFRVLGRRALQEISIEQNGMAHASEIIYKIYKNNLKIKEMPITVLYNEFGQNIFSEARGGGGIRVLKDLLISKLID